MRKFFLVSILLFATGAFLKAQMVDVTFQVDMSVVIATQTFNPATDTVRIRGSFNGWGAGVDMADVNNDSVFTVTLTGQPQATTISYKFFHTGNNGTWESDPNREINTGSSSTLTVDPSFFNDHNPYSGVTSPIDFSIDMHLPAQSSFDPANDHVWVAGNFTNWGTGALEMEDLDGDTIYTLTFSDFTSGDLAIYKFVYGSEPSPVPNGTWESPQEGDDWFLPDHNRIYGVHDGTNEVSRWWNNTNPNVQLASGNIYFEVDMSVANELGLFNPSTDSVQIRGAFNGWNGSDVEKSHMNRNAVFPNRWFIEIPLVNEVLHSNQLYKFWINNDYSNTGWEVPIEHTNGTDRNRGVIFQGDPSQSAPYQYFENINPDWVIPAGTSVECTFMVDMTNAANPDSQTVPFVPGTDTVFWSPLQPLYFALHGYPWGVNPRALVLTDPNNDMIYTGTLTINGPAFNGFLYNYAYSTGTAGTLISESGGQGGARVRFIGQNGARTFVSPWDMPLDVWSNSEKPEEYQPAGWTDVKEISGNPQTYSLEQNFPNPFNPSTKIRFSIPEQGLVTLKVFNLLGEEVATLINTEMTTGTYDVDFRATDVSSGIYFYTLTSGNFISTKKMIVLK